MQTKRSFLNAVKWSYTANWGERGFAAIFTFVLAAILGPRDFGIVVIAMAYILFIRMFLDQGLVSALIQRKDLEAGHLDAVFWMDLALSFLLIGLSMALSRWWAAANHLPQLSAIITALSLTIPIEALAVVQRALLQREMNFRSLSLAANAAVLVSGAVGLAMAFTGFGVWALVGQQILRDFAALTLLWRLSPWRPRLRFSFRYLRDLMGFSTAQFVAQLGGFADGQAGVILTGFYFGAVPVGLYRLAQRFCNTVLVTATSSLQAVSLPEFSRLQDKPAELRRSIISCVRLSSVVTLPALAGLAVVSRPLMAAVGQQWVPTVDALRILCVLGMAIMFSYFTGPLLQALSKPHYIAGLEWARTVVKALALVLAVLLLKHSTVTQQVTGIAFATFIAGALIVTPVYVIVLMRSSGLSLGDLARAAAPSLISAGAVVAAVICLGTTGLVPQTSPLVTLLCDGAAGGATGIAVILIVDVQVRNGATGLLRNIFRYAEA